MKQIIVISGNPILKNRFDAVLSSAKDETSGEWTYHRWNLNPKNPLKSLANDVIDILELDHVKESENSERYVSELVKLSNKHFRFEESYIRKMINRFQSHAKCKLLILHSVGRELVEKLKGEGLVVALHLKSKDEDEKNALYDYVLVEGENFENDVVEFLKSLK